MKALIAFIIMAVMVLTLIEINERIKAKKKKDDCPQKEPTQADCQECGLHDVCESTHAR